MEFKTYRNQNGGEVRAHVVTEDEEGQTVGTRGGGSRNILAGDVLVETYRPGEYDFPDSRDFLDNYTTDDNSPNDAERVAVTRDQGPQFDPNEHTAAEVREYLSSGLNDAERERVETAERDGRNRSTAFPA